MASWKLNVVVVCAMLSVARGQVLEDANLMNLTRWGFRWLFIVVRRRRLNFVPIAAPLDHTGLEVFFLAWVTMKSGGLHLHVRVRTEVRIRLLILILLFFLEEDSEGLALATCGS